VRDSTIVSLCSNVKSFERMGGVYAFDKGQHTRSRERTSGPGRGSRERGEREKGRKTLKRLCACGVSHRRARWKGTEILKENEERREGRDEKKEQITVTDGLLQTLST
jgi:hypothetical protein